MRVKKVCENCGREYEGAPQSRFHSDACRKAFARAQLVDETLPTRQLDEELPPADGRPLRGLLKLDPYAALTDSEEQSLRDHWGYASSERRTRAERATAARHIRDAAGPPGQTYLKALEILTENELAHKRKQEAWLSSLERTKVPEPA